MPASITAMSTFSSTKCLRQRIRRSNTCRGQDQGNFCSAYSLKGQSRDNFKVAQCAAFLRLVLSNLRLVLLDLSIAIAR